MSHSAFSDPHRIQYFEVIGRVDGTNTVSLFETLDKAIANGFTQLILDLNGVVYINSAGLRELVMIFKRVQQKGGMLHIANPSDYVKTVLELVGLDTLFEIHTNFSLDLLNLSRDNGSILHPQICYLS